MSVLILTTNTNTRSISHPFLGDYVRLRQNPQWKKMCGNTNDQYVVFADIINKITRTSGKVSGQHACWEIVFSLIFLLTGFDYN